MIILIIASAHYNELRPTTTEWFYKSYICPFFNHHHLHQSLPSIPFQLIWYSMVIHALLMKVTMLRYT